MYNRITSIMKLGLCHEPTDRKEMAHMLNKIYAAYTCVTVSPKQRKGLAYICAISIKFIEYKFEYQKYIHVDSLSPASTPYNKHHAFYP